MRSKPPLPHLLDFDFGPVVFENLFDLFSFVFADGFLNGLRRAFDEVLGLLQTEARDATDLFNDVDLLVASGSKDNVELGLLFSRSSSSAWRSSSNGNRCRSRNAPLLFEQFGKLSCLKDSQS